jgi:hypothetical protein
MTGDTILETLQADILAVLANTPALAGAQVIAEDSGDMESEVLRKLGTLTDGPLGKKGLVIVVNLPEVDTAEGNLPGPPVRISLSIQVIEQPVINRDTTSGTGIRSSVAAIRTLAALHLRSLANALLVAGEKPITAVRGMKKGFLGHTVTLGLQYRGIEPATKVQQVAATWTQDDTLTLSTATAAAIIYTTTDGSYPTPSNLAARRYTAPIANLAVGTRVRAAAYHATATPSDLTELTISAA